jgi:biotin transport system substrate-specific component
LVNLSLSALFAAFFAAGAFVSVPLPISPVPITIQNLFAIMAGLVLGPVWGAFSVLLYLFAGAIGLPVFAGAVGGFVHFASPSGGYLYGYLIAAFVAGLIAGGGAGGGKKLHKARLAVAVIGAFIIVYIPGILQLKIILQLPLRETFVLGFFPFVIGDAIKAVFAFLMVPKLHRAISHAAGE